MNTKESFWTIPNMLSSYRILIFPFVVYLVFSGQEKLYAIFIALNLISDWLDGQRTVGLRSVEGFHPGGSRALPRQLE